MRVAKLAAPIIALAICSVLSAPVAARVWHVPAEAPTIQAGIDSASVGDIVMVAPGVYQEHIVLASGISVLGENSLTTIIDGGGASIDVVRAINVDDVEFSGFTVTGAISGGGLPGGAGVFVNFPDASIVIEDVIATGNDFGIAVFNSFQYSGPDILNCDIHDNNFYGISNPGHGLISGCLIYFNLDGIHQSGNSSQPQIIGNTIWGNYRDGFNYWNDNAPTLLDNIFAANGEYGIRERAPGTFVDPIVEYNLFWDNGYGNYYDVQTGMVMDTAIEINGMPNAANNLVDDPLICAAPNNFHLCADSPAIGAGQGGGDIGALPVGCPPCGPVAVGDELIPGERIVLSQNFPNPFNPATTIGFNLPEAQTVSLTMYSLDGRLVATLVNEPMPAGQHEAVWMGQDDTGRRVAAGTYLYRLQAGVFSETKRMLLLK